MKKFKNIFPLLIVALILLVSSCVDDLSTAPDNDIRGVEIDTTGNSSISILKNDLLKISPEIKTDLNPAQLKYEWRINVVPGDTLYEVIGKEKKLEHKIKLRPNSKTDPYQLVLAITDTKTGLKYFQNWPLFVLNNLGEGLVVATKAGAGETDLSLIMSPRVTEGYEEVKIQRDIFSSVNGRLIQGVVKEMLFIPSWFGEKAMLAITDNSIIKINTLEYKFAGKNKDLFFYHAGDFKPQMLGRIQQKTFFVEGEVLTVTYLAANEKFEVAKEAEYVAPGELALNNNTAIKMSFYDEINENFVYFPVGFFNQTLNKTPAATDGAFNPANVKNKVNIAAGTSVDGGFRHILKDKQTQEYILYILDGGDGGYPNNTPPAPVAKINISGAPAIGQAHEFVIADNQKVIYYATDTKIYAILYGGQDAIYELRYTAPAGETITTLQYYHQVGYPYESVDGSFIKTNGKQLIMSTYNGTEGKVYLLPITNLGVGFIDEANIKVFGGFGKVTAITPQK